MGTSGARCGRAYLCGNMKENEVMIGMAFGMSMAAGGRGRALNGRNAPAGSAGRARRRVLHFNVTCPAFSASLSWVWFSMRPVEVVRLRVPLPSPVPPTPPSPEAAAPASPGCASSALTSATLSRGGIATFWCLHFLHSPKDEDFAPFHATTRPVPRPPCAVKS